MPRYLNSCEYTTTSDFQFTLLIVQTVKDFTLYNSYKANLMCTQFIFDFML